MLIHLKTKSVHFIWNVIKCIHHLYCQRHKQRWRIKLFFCVSFIIINALFLLSLKFTFCINSFANDEKMLNKILCWFSLVSESSSNGEFWLAVTGNGGRTHQDQKWASAQGDGVQIHGSYQLHEAAGEEAETNHQQVQVRVLISDSINTQEKRVLWNRNTYLKIVIWLLFFCIQTRLLILFHIISSISLCQAVKEAQPGISRDAASPFRWNSCHKAGGLAPTARCLGGSVNQCGENTPAASHMREKTHNPHAECPLILCTRTSKAEACSPTNPNVLKTPDAGGEKGLLDHLTSFLFNQFVLF